MLLPVQMSVRYLDHRVNCAMTNVKWLLVVAIVLPNVGGWLGSISVTNNMSWYMGLNRAPWSPPNWVFGPAWTIFYSLMGWASYIVLESRNDESPKTKVVPPLIVYVIQLLLNWAWTPILFTAHSFLWAFVEICAVGLSALICMLLFFHVKAVAGILMIPYIIWVGVASSLSYYLLANN